MPASMMMPSMGDRWKVIGSNSPMVASGPMPGRTPMKVPKVTPMKQ
jgi:hypothetical protein